MYDHATDNGLITVTKTAGDVCTRLHVIPGASTATLPISPGRWDVRATNGPCADANGALAVGALGSIAYGRSDAGATIDLHAAFYFEGGAGSTRAVRMDIDGLTFDPFGCRP